MRFTKSFAVAGIAILTLAACGGSTTTPTAAPTPTAALTAGATATPAPTTAATGTPAATGSTADLCSLLTAADIFTVLRLNTTEGVMANDYCHWDTPSQDQLITAFQAGDIASVKSRAPGGVDMDVSGHQGYSLSQPNNRLFSVWVDIGEQLLTIEFPTSSDASADQVGAQALAEIAVGNL